MELLESKFLKAGIEVDKWSIRKWITSSLTTPKSRGLKFFIKNALIKRQKDGI